MSFRRPGRLTLSVVAVVALVAPVLAQVNLAWPLRPPSTSGSFLAGRAAFADLNTGLAARFLVDAARNDPDNPEVVGRTVEGLAAQGRIDDAADLAGHALELNPNDELAAIIAAARAMKQRRYAAALRDLDPVGTDNFTGIAGTILRAWAQVGAGEYDRAMATLVSLDKAGLANFLLFHKALMADVAGETAAATDFSAQAVAANTAQQARIVEAIARILARAGDTQRASELIASFEGGGQFDPFVDQVKQDIAQGRVPLQPVDGAGAGAAEMFSIIGLILASDGYSEISAIMLRLALYLNPEADQVTMLLGRLYEETGRYDIANAIFDTIGEASPIHAQAIVRLAANLAAEGDTDGALSRLEEILAEHPGQLEALQAKGNLLHSEERYDDAIDTFTQLLAASGGIRPRDWIYYYSRAISYERDKRWPQAEADFLKALELNPSEPRVLNYLGYSWVDRGENLERGLEMIEKAVAAQPNEGYIVDSLGWAYYRLGRYDEAVEALERAVRLDPSDVNLNDHLGDAYWQVGRKREARFQWTIARDLDPQSDIAEAVIRKLQVGLGPQPAA